MKASSQERLPPRGERGPPTEEQRPRARVGGEPPSTPRQRREALRQPARPDVHVLAQLGVQLTGLARREAALDGAPELGVGAVGGGGELLHHRGRLGPRYRHLAPGLDAIPQVVGREGIAGVRPPGRRAGEELQAGHEPVLDLAVAPRQHGRGGGAGDAPPRRGRRPVGVEGVPEDRAADEGLEGDGAPQEQRRRELQPDLGARHGLPGQPDRPVVEVDRIRAVVAGVGGQELAEVSDERREARDPRPPLELERTERHREERRAERGPPLQRRGLGPKPAEGARAPRLDGRDERLVVGRARLQHEVCRAARGERVRARVVRVAREPGPLEVAEHEGVLGEREVADEPHVRPQVLPVAPFQGEPRARPSRRCRARRDPPARPARPTRPARPLVVLVLDHVPAHEALRPLRGGPAQLEPCPGALHRASRLVRVPRPEEVLGGGGQVRAAPKGQVGRLGQVPARRRGRAELGEEEPRLAVEERQRDPRQDQHRHRTLHEQEARGHVERGPVERGAVVGHPGPPRAQLPGGRLPLAAVAEREPRPVEREPALGVPLHPVGREGDPVPPAARLLERGRTGQLEGLVLEKGDHPRRLERPVDHGVDAVGVEDPRGVDEEHVPGRLDLVMGRVEERAPGAKQDCSPAHDHAAGEVVGAGLGVPDRLSSLERDVTRGHGARAERRGGQAGEERGGGESGGRRHGVREVARPGSLVPFSLGCGISGRHVPRRRRPRGGRGRRPLEVHHQHVALDPLLVRDALPELHGQHVARPLAGRRHQLDRGGEERGVQEAEVVAPRGLRVRHLDAHRPIVDLLDGDLRRASSSGRTPGTRRGAA